MIGVRAPLSGSRVPGDVAAQERDPGDTRWLELTDVCKAFGAVTALESVHLVVTRGEFVALLGPSGCGKTTLLQVMAGFQTPDRGTVALRGRILNAVPSYRRNIGLVFQHYALFPHMTVMDNIGYGLEARKLPREEIRNRVREMIALLQLQSTEDRYPSQLSGGQQQRVALARALAIRPALLLIDEGLSALDKHLRERMQVELSLLQRQLGITTIFVTHDQREAFTMADRVVLMDRGQLVQVGTPAEIYERPRTSFAVEFVGSANHFPGVVRPTAHGASVVVQGGLEVPVPTAGAGAEGDPVQVYVRAEDVRLSREPTLRHAADPGRVELKTYLGATVRYVVELHGQRILVERSAVGHEPFDVGDQVFLDFDLSRCHLLR